MHAVGANVAGQIASVIAGGMILSFWREVVMENILRSLDVLWKGMLAIFIVMGAVFLFVFLMNRLDNLNKKKRQDK